MNCVKTDFKYFKERFVFLLKTTVILVKVVFKYSYFSSAIYF